MTDSTGQHSGLFLSPSLPLSLAEFQRVLSAHVMELEQQLRSLHIVDQQLHGAPSPGRALYRQLLSLLDTNLQMLERFRLLLERYEYLPDEVVARRYLPLMFLQNATVQTHHLLRLLSRLREARRKRSASKEEQLQRQELLAAWDHLLHQYEELLFHGRALSDQTRFLLRRRLSPERQKQAPISAPELSPPPPEDATGQTAHPHPGEQTGSYQDQQHRQACQDRQHQREIAGEPQVPELPREHARD